MDATRPQDAAHVHAEHGEHQEVSFRSATWKVVPFPSSLSNQTRPCCVSAMRVGMSGVVASGAVAFAIAAACGAPRGSRPSAATEASDAEPAQLRVNL